MSLSVAAVLSAIAVFALTGFFRTMAIRWDIIDVPNDRSSHDVPTPRGGGVSFVIVYLLSVLLLGAYGVIGQGLALGLGGAGAIVALAGYFDDRWDVAARWRLLTQFIAVVWGL